MEILICFLVFLASHFICISRLGYSSITNFIGTVDFVEASFTNLSFSIEVYLTLSSF